MILKELLPFLHSLGRRPNKNLSQNFLVDPNIGRKIVEIADVSGTTVFEIGPGTGALTSLLLQKNVPVIAVEKDLVLAAALQRQFIPKMPLTLFTTDILEFNWDLLTPHAPLKVVANLPYNITTPILEALLTHRHLFSTFTLMVQDEVAARIAAKPGTSAFSSLSLYLQFHTELKDSFKVSPTCFYPRPKVASRVLHLELKPPPIPEEKLLFSLIHRAFQMRRKMIRTSLQSLLSSSLIEEGLTHVGASKKARPEELSLEEWVLFFNLVKPALQKTSCIT